MPLVKAKHKVRSINNISEVIYASCCFSCCCKIVLKCNQPFLLFKGLWGMKTPGQSHEQRDETIQANKRRVTKMLFIVVLMFGICWLPFQTFNLLSSLNFPLKSVATRKRGVAKCPKICFLIFSFRGINYIWMASHILAMSNSSCNPLIYGIYNVSMDVASA